MKQKKLRIVFISEYFWPRTAGGEVWAWELCRELARRGHDVTVLTLKYQPGLAERQTKDGVTILRLASTTEDVDNRIERWIAIQRFLRSARRLLAASKPDLIHVMAYGLNVPISKYAASRNIPCVTSIHSYFGKHWLSLLGTGVVLRLAEQRKITSDRSIQRVVPSEYLQHKILKEARKKTHVIPNWAPDEFPKPKKFSRPTLLFVGSLEPIKDPLAGLSVAKRLRMPLVVVGSGSLERRLLREAAQANIPCTVIPKATRNETLSMLGGASLVLVPSITESFSLVALEANAQGTPVAGRPVGILPQLPGVISWPPKHVPKRLSKARVQKIRKSFSRDTAVDAFEQLYKQVAHQRKR